MSRHGRPRPAMLHNGCAHHHRESGRTRDLSRSAFRGTRRYQPLLPVRLSIVYVGNERDHPAVRKIQVLDRLALFVQRLFEAQFDGFELLPQSFEFLRAQQPQNPIPITVLLLRHTLRSAHVRNMTYCRNVRCLTQHQRCQRESCGPSPVSTMRYPAR